MRATRVEYKHSHSKKMFVVNDFLNKFKGERDT